ncbi:hypothetical protein [Leptospira meyeri]|uniref:hypothetical protein n=1 Tax=Leptospira meyeri TaxID=29508 RepID=UPI000C2A603D|nr:hypothetical protein [Leptospira meyeri]PJZ80952.1 hypothetical protein CH359_11460 [Leptospira meyeri]PJZ96456.1 hypothetical protein CH358_13130 [Leptospira meyeri]PKA11069.1 hypothetical protein CH372_16080 [Leptospira meyeri]
MVQTIGINHGMTLYKSIHLDNQKNLRKDLDEKNPKYVPLFTDKRYTFIFDRPNHRMVNHSKSPKTQDIIYPVNAGLIEMERQAMQQKQGTIFLSKVSEVIHISAPGGLSFTSTN